MITLREPAAVSMPDQHRRKAASCNFIHLLFGMVLLALSGCASTGAPDLAVEQQWGDTMRRLGMFAFYPATEDVRIGDVYLIVPSPSGFLAWGGRVTDPLIPWSKPDHDGTRFSLLRLGSLGAGRREIDASGNRTALGHLAEQQAERPAVQAFSDVQYPFEKAPDGRPKPRSIQSHTAQKPNLTDYQIGVADQSEIAPRLQRSSIPGLTVARVSVGKLDAGGALGPFLRSLGFTQSSEMAVDITLGDIQELTLEPYRVEQLYRDYGPALFRDRLRPGYLMDRLRSMRYGRNNIHDLTKPACRGEATELRDQGVQIAIIAHVMYAGWVDYSFLQTTTTSGQAAYGPAAPVNAAPQTPATAGAATGETPQSAPKAPPTMNDLAALLKAMRASLDSSVGALVNSNSAGPTKVSFGTSNLGRLSLRESFNRPVAVGAGTRKILAFHDALRGIDSPLPGDDFWTRFNEASGYCRREFVVRELIDYSGARRDLCRTMSAGEYDDSCARLER